MPRQKRAVDRRQKLDQGTAMIKAARRKNNVSSLKRKRTPFSQPLPSLPLYGFSTSTTLCTRMNKKGWLKNCKWEEDAGAYKGPISYYPRELDGAKNVGNEHFSPDEFFNVRTWRSDAIRTFVYFLILDMVPACGTIMVESIEHSRLYWQKHT